MGLVGIATRRTVHLTVMLLWTGGAAGLRPSGSFKLMQSEGGQLHARHFSSSLASSGSKGSDWLVARGKSKSALANACNRQYLLDVPGKWFHS